MPKWWHPAGGAAGVVGCVVVPDHEEARRQARRMRHKAGRAAPVNVVAAPWRLAGTTLSVAEATRVGPALGIYSVSRVNPIFVDEDYASQRFHYPTVYHNAAPESPGKSGSSGYESNPCSDELPSRRGDPRHFRASGPRRAAASRAARRQACSVHRQNLRQGPLEDRAHEGDSDEGYARLPLAPIPEGRVGAPYRALAATDVISRGCAGDSPASYSPASTASSSPASSSSSSSGKRLLKKADAAILLWGHGTNRGSAPEPGSPTPDPGGVAPNPLRDALKASSSPSPLSSAPSTVSSGASIPPLRGTVLPEDVGGAEGGATAGKTPQERAQTSAETPVPDSPKVPPPADPPDRDRVPRGSPAIAEGPAACSHGHHWAGFHFPPQFVRRGSDSEDGGGVPTALKNAMLYGTLYRIKAGVDAYEKLKAMERDGPSSSGEGQDGNVSRSPWGGWSFDGVGPVLGKEVGSSGKLQAPNSPSPSTASSQGKHFTGLGHADFTLDMPRAERLMRQIAAAKRRRCWGRFLATTFALVFFFISVVAVSMLCTRGKRVFGPL